MPKHNTFLFKKRIMSTFLGLRLAATTSPALENKLSDGTDVPHVPCTPKYITWTTCKYRIGVARNQVSILHEEVSVLVVSIIVVSYRPCLFTAVAMGLKNAGGVGQTPSVVSEPDPRKIEKRVWEIGWGGSVHCARNAGTLPIDSWLHAYARLLKIQTATR